MIYFIHQVKNTSQTRKGKKMYKQVKFLNAYDDRILCGIGIFEDNKLIGVICDEGGFFGADDVLWYEVRMD